MRMLGDLLFVLLGLLMEWAHAGKEGGGGVPVPGRSVPAIRIFQLYSHSCAPSDRASTILSHLSNVLENVDATAMANNLYNSLYMAVGDIDIRKLMGKWFTVMDTRSIHPQHCSVFYFELLEKTPYTATFTVRQYFRNTEKMEILEGYGRKMGPDPAELLINIGLDACPYSVICCGPTNDNEQYDYLILTQPLKYPTIVLARDPVDFDVSYKLQVEKFLENQYFWNHSPPFKNTLLFLNTTDCFETNQYNMGL